MILCSRQLIEKSKRISNTFKERKKQITSNLANIFTGNIGGREKGLKLKDKLVLKPKDFIYKSCGPM